MKSIQKTIKMDINAAPVKTCLGRVVILEEYFPPSGTFQAYYKALARLKELGYVTGSMCGGEPIGFVHSEKYDYVAKWRNLNSKEIAMLDGVMLSEGFREDGVKIIFFNPIKK